MAHPLRGFSFHDDKAAFRIMTIMTGTWRKSSSTTLTIRTSQLGRLRYAGDKGIPVVVMEPLRGGALANPPRDVKSLIDAHPGNRSAVDWAFRYVGDFPQVATILSGMTTMEQLQENLRVFEQVLPNSLSGEEHDFIARL